TLQASGPGSVLDMRNVVTITNGQRYDSNLTIEAADQGKINLSHVTQIIDPAVGDSSFRAINVTADGSGSNVMLFALTNFQDNNAGSTTGGVNRSSTLTAQHGGAVTVEAATTLFTGVAIAVQTSGALNGNPQLAQNSVLSGNGTVFGLVENGGTIQPGING